MRARARCALQRRRFREIFPRSKEQNRADSPSVGSAALIGGIRAALESAFPCPGENFSTPRMLHAKKRKRDDEVGAAGRFTFQDKQLRAPYIDSGILFR